MRQHQVILLLMMICTGCSNGTTDDTSQPSSTAEPSVVINATSVSESPDSTLFQLETTVAVPPNSGISNEGDVLIDVRTANAVVDTAWISRSSGYQEVDEYALNYFLQNFKNLQVGMGDPPFQMLVSVRVPSATGDNTSLSITHESEQIYEYPVVIPSNSDIKNEGDVLFEVDLVDGFIDTARILESSGYPEVDEFASELMQSWKQARNRTIEVDSAFNKVKVRLFVRH